jgi:hypothetical protein
MRQIRLAVLTVIVLLGVLVSGCAANPSSPTREPLPTDRNPLVRVVVTRDFGKEVLLEADIEIGQNISVLEALQQVAEVKTKYGGGFVSAINGVSSEYEGANRTKKDWLFYVNGTAAKVGANDYILEGGDIEHWDFRDWSYHQFVPAIIGDFPQPFLSGKPTIIVYDRGFEEYAQSLAETLGKLGGTEVSVQGYHQLTETDRRNSNLILLGTKDNELISELNDIYTRLGFYAYFGDEKLVTLDSKGEIAGEDSAGSGLIQATQNPWNPKGVGAGENVVWVVSGIDETGVKRAVEALINRQADFKYAYALVIARGKVIKLPR